MSNKTLIIILCLFITAGAWEPLRGQTRVGVSDFSNESGIFFLDRWEQIIPDMLQAKLSKSGSLVILERRKLKAVLEEQALSQSGLTDSTSANRSGTLSDAEYVITGSINKVGGLYRIDARIVKVSSGESHAEKAEATSKNHLNRMLDLLANNILYHLTGQGEYKSHLNLPGYPGKYFFAATAVFAGAAIWVRQDYQKKRDAYSAETQLERFDELYNQANRRQKWSVALAGAATFTFTCTVYCWIRNLSPQRVLAEGTQPGRVVPLLTSNFRDEVKVGFQIHF